MEGSTTTTPSDRPVAVGELEALLRRLAHPAPDLDDMGRIDQIEVLERLKGACAGAQARLAVDYATSRRDDMRHRGVSTRDAQRSIGAEVALARRESPARGRGHLRLAQALIADMPTTHRALLDGRITESAAGLVVRATAGLSPADRAAVDARLADSLGTVSETKLEATARALAYELDPEAFVARARKAATDRRVTIRPAPDVMSYVTALLPVEEGVACYAALTQQADALRRSGDERTRGQIAADTFVERVTGRSPATGVDVEVQVVMTDRSLFAGAETSGRIPGFGPIPAELARDLARRGTTRPEVPDDPLSEVARAWIRRVFLAPEDASVRDLDSGRRAFDGRLRRLVVARDQVCRTPWCGAPVRHADHVVPVSGAGRTTTRNGQGLCEACNYIKETLGWTSRVVRQPDGRDVVETTTPTGHTYRSAAPPCLDSMTDLPTDWAAARDGPADPPEAAPREVADGPEADLRAAVEAWQRLVEEYRDEEYRDEEAGAADPYDLEDDVMAALWADAGGDDEDGLAG